MQNKRIMIRQVSAALRDMNIHNGIIRLFRQWYMVEVAPDAYLQYM